MSIEDNESILLIREDIACVGVVHESIAITGVLEGFFDTVDWPEVVLDFTLSPSDLELGHVDVRCGAGFLHFGPTS